MSMRKRGSNLASVSVIWTLWSISRCAADVATPFLPLTGVIIIDSDNMAMHKKVGVIARFVYTNLQAAHANEGEYPNERFLGFGKLGQEGPGLHVVEWKYTTTDQRNEKSK